jgi:hypothetical protein
MADAELAGTHLAEGTGLWFLLPPCIDQENKHV